MHVQTSSGQNIKITADKGHTGGVGSAGESSGRGQVFHSSLGGVYNALVSNLTPLNDAVLAGALRSGCIVGVHRIEHHVCLGNAISLFNTLCSFRIEIFGDILHIHGVQQCHICAVRNCDTGCVQFVGDIVTSAGIHGDGQLDGGDICSAKADCKAFRQLHSAFANDSAGGFVFFCLTTGNQGQDHHGNQQER